VENYAGAYLWGKYDIAIMPKNFPIGGMEHPLMTFFNPHLLRENKDDGITTVLHEIAHSWTGNTVTTQNWDSVFINEGFTVFLERKAV